MDDLIKKNLEKVRNYFENVRNILDDLDPTFFASKAFMSPPYSSYKLFKVLEAVNEWEKMKNLVNQCKINHYESISDTREKKMYVDIFRYEAGNKYGPYIPIELLCDGPCVSFGNIENISCKNLEIFLPINNKNYTFSNGNKEYCLMHFDEMLEIQKKYKKIFLLDDIFYTKVPRTNSEIHKKLSCAVTMFDYNFNKLKQEKENFNLYLNTLNNLADIRNILTNNYFSDFKRFAGINSMGWLLEPFNNIYIIDEGRNIPMGHLYKKTVINLDNYSYNYEFEILENEPSDCRGYITYNDNKAIKQILSKEDTGYIIINLNNLKNIVNKTYNYDSNEGYLLVSKSDPINITPVNVSRDDYEWLTNFIERCNMGWPYSNDDPNFQNIYYLYFEEALSISSQSIEDVFFTYCLINGGIKSIKKFIPIKLEETIFDKNYEIKFNQQIFNIYLIFYALSLPFNCGRFKIDQVTNSLKFELNDKSTNIKDWVTFCERLYIQILKYYKLKDNKIVNSKGNAELFYNIMNILSYYDNYINDSKVKEKILSIPFKTYDFRLDIL